MNTNMYNCTIVQGKRQGEESRVKAVVCDDNIVLKVVWEVIDVV